jgi:[acyl-carrier-protein] S-malonyltransferase
MSGNSQPVPREFTAAESAHARTTPARSPLVFLFPGQSSATPDLLVRARLAHPAAAQVADVAYRVLGADRASRYLSHDGAPLQSNRDVQLSVFLATQMYLTALATEGIHADQSLGLSLGEYSHLVDIGALDLESALALVDERGRCYDEAPHGVMVTVLAVDHDTVASVVEQAQSRGRVVISNYNAPTQHVLAGSRDAVAWAASTLEDEHSAMTATIEERVPMHSPLMDGVAQAFAPALSRAPWHAPTRPYWPNVAGAPVASASAGDFVSNLTRHVSEPVRWQTSIDAVVAAHPGVSFVEVGPGRVLHNMVSRAWRGVPCSRVDGLHDADPATHFRSTLEVLRARP